MLQPQAYSVLWFLAGFLGLWACSLIVRGVLHRSRAGVPVCPGCGAAVPAADEGGAPRTVCPSCRYEASSRREFWPRTPHRPAIVAGALLILGAAGIAYAGYAEAIAVRRAASGLLLDAASYGAAVGAVLLTAWALWGSAPRGRKRCPACWYDMDAVAAAGRLVCPECGHDAGAVRNLLRRRRRTRLAWASALLIPASLAIPRVVAGVQRGPLAAVPGPVLVLGMWALPDSWINPPAPTQATRENLASRLQARDGLAGPVRAWAFSRVRAGLRAPSSPAGFRRAAELAWLDPDRGAVAALLAGAILDLADSPDLDHRAVRVAFAPRLGFLPAADTQPLREVLLRRRDELGRLIAREDPEANTLAYLAIALGPDAGPLVPALDAGVGATGPGLGWASALRVLSALADSCPQAEGAVLRAMASPDPRTVCNAIDAGSSVPGGSPAIARRLRELTDSPDVAVAVAAFRHLGWDWTWFSAEGGRIRELAEAPGPRREVGLRAFAATPRTGVELAEVLAGAARDPDRRVRLVVVELAQERWQEDARLRAILRGFDSDPDPGVAQASRVAEASLPR